MDTRSLPQSVMAGTTASPEVRTIRRLLAASIVVVALGAAGCAAGTSDPAGTSTTVESGGDGKTPNSTDTGDTPMPDGPADDFDWDTILAAFVPEVAPGWSEPVFLDVSREGWFESQHIADDGQTLYLFSYTADLDFFTLRLTDGPFTDDPDTRISRFPFTTTEAIDEYYLSDDLYSTSGVSTDADGNFFYSTNREGRDDGEFPGEYDRQNIYRNDEVLAFNTRDEPADNPFYLKATDELWYDCVTDQMICVLRDAAANDFAGQPVPAPAPVNLRTEASETFGAGLTDDVNAQPWLTPDGQTLYFTSNRGRPGEGPWIYVSERLDEEGQEWSEPEVVVKSRLAVGEPTMPSDESRLFFVQFVMNDNINSETGLGEFRTAMYYIEPE